MGLPEPQVAKDQLQGCMQRCEFQVVLSGSFDSSVSARLQIRLVIVSAQQRERPCQRSLDPEVHREQFLVRRGRYPHLLNQYQQ